MRSSIGKLVNQSATTATAAQLTDNDNNQPTPNHHPPHSHYYTTSQYNHYNVTSPQRGVTSHSSSRRSSVASAIHQQMINKSDEMLLTEQGVQTLSPRSDRGVVMGDGEGRLLVERNANWEQGDVELEMVSVCQCTVKDHHSNAQRPRHQQPHFHHHPSHPHLHKPHLHHHLSHTHHAHPHQHLPPTKYNSVQNIALVNHQPFCASLTKLDGQWSSSTLINATANSSNHQYSLERRTAKKPPLKKQHSYTCESHQPQQMTQQQRIMARVERDLRMQQAQHLSRSPPPPLPPEVLAGNILVSDEGFVTTRGGDVEVTFVSDSDVIKSPYSGSVGSGSGKDSVVRGGRGPQAGGDDYGFSKRMQQQEQQQGGASQGRGSKRNSLRSNGGSGGKRRPAGDGMASITPLHDDNTDLIFELPDQMNESGVTLSVDGATTVVDCDHIIYGPGFTYIHFIPIKSMEILNVTNCDRFRETTIVSTVTVTRPDTAKDGDRKWTQTLSISLKNDADFDDKAVIYISDMKPVRSPNENSTTNWTRNKVYINRHNLCDVLNNYVATAIFKNTKSKASRKITDDDPGTNIVESRNENSEIRFEKHGNKMKLCPIAAGHYVLPKLTWSTPSISVPALFLGYQKYMIEVTKPSVDANNEDMLLCKVVTVFLHPEKNI